METESDIESICKQIQEKAMKATKCSLSLNSSEFNYYNSFDKFNKIIKHQNTHSLLMLSSLIENENKGKKIEKLVSDEDKYDLISELNDNMLDSIGNHLDEASGLKKKDEQLVLATLNATDKSLSSVSVKTSSWNRHIIRAKRVGNCNLVSAKMVERSQLRFRDKTDNSNNPFVPVIKDKPNSIKPLSILVEKTETGFDTYSHPYEVEIEKFEPNDQFLQIEIPEMPKPVSETSFKFVSNKEDLIELSEHLKSCQVIAVDLEHHSYRTFQGFTCLMQISTKTCDYLIDTIELRSEMHCLNQVFTSPSILKVFHGSDMDVVWMQRDFGLYLVNLFDTYQSAKLLNFPHLSLSYLLKHYCNLEPNKQFQLADWRVRPLNEQLVKYAREDTHYLIFIYIQMKNELIARGNNEKNLLRAVFERSKTVCLKKYEKPLYNSESYRSLLKKSKVEFNSKQLYALKELYAWRDRVARNEDESIGYVLPNHMLLHMAEVLPREQQGILACCNPIPPLIKQQLNEIHLIILKARDRPLIKSDESSKHSSNTSSLTHRVIDLDELLDCRHDRFPLDSDINPRTLLEDSYENKSFESEEMETQTKDNRIVKSSPFVQLFSSNNVWNSSKAFERIDASFTSPFERYKMTINSKTDLKNENKEMSDKSVSNDNMNRVYSHYLSLASGSDGKSEPLDASIETNESPNTSTNDSKVSDISDNSLEKCNSDMNRKFQKRQKTDPKSVEPFAYEDYDYSTFSANNSSNSGKSSQTNANRIDNKKRNQMRRNESKSYTYNPNKKHKY